jgi:putative redox protein
MQTATVVWVEKEQFRVKTPSGHEFLMDSDRENNSGPGPMELLLVALGTCTATDVVSILAKKRQPLKKLEIIVSGERATEPPTVWTKIEVFYRLWGTLDEKGVRDTIELSENKYCSVAAMLKKTAEISYQFEILRS